MMREDLVLAHDPFAGDFGGDGDRTLSDKIVTAQKSKVCHDCRNMIKPGERIRSRVDISDGELMSFRWCQACCEAMEVYDSDPDILEARISLDGEGHE